MIQFFVMSFYYSFYFEYFLQEWKTGLKLFRCGDPVNPGKSTLYFRDKFLNKSFSISSKYTN